MRVLLLLFFAFSVHAQSFQYRLEGSFTTEATPGFDSTAVVNYSINWNETSTTIQGIYQDNYFSQSLPRTLSGTVTASGRSMNVILPQTENEVRQISIGTQVTGLTSGSVPVNVTTRNNIGSVIDSPNTFALLTVLPNATSGATSDEDTTCVVGFGALTGSCGLYGGSFTEIRDNRDRCYLLSAGTPRLELGVNTAFSLLLNYIPGANEQLTHTIGSFIPSPQTNSISITSRNCGNLPGTTFVSGNCKTLNLSGLFIPDNAGNFQFNGTYTITDDVNADSCAYTMNLTREVSY